MPLLFPNDYKTDRVVIISRLKSVCVLYRTRRICDTKSYPFFVVFPYNIVCRKRPPTPLPSAPPSTTSRPTTLADHRQKYAVDRIYIYYYIIYTFIIVYVHSYFSIYAHGLRLRYTRRRRDGVVAAVHADDGETLQNCTRLYFILSKRHFKKYFYFYFMDSPSSSLTYYCYKYTYTYYAFIFYIRDVYYIRCRYVYYTLFNGLKCKIHQGYDNGCTLYYIHQCAATSSEIGAATRGTLLL